MPQHLTQVFPRRDLRARADYFANQNNYATVILGDEYDDQLRAKLLAALRSLGAVPNNPSSKALAGSQEIEEFDVAIDGQPVHVEAETYIGLSISGPEGIVNRVHKLVMLAG